MFLLNDSVLQAEYSDTKIYNPNNYIKEGEKNIDSNPIKCIKPHSTSLSYIFFRLFLKILNTNLAREVSHTSYDSDSWQTTGTILQLKELII